MQTSFLTEKPMSFSNWLRALTFTSKRRGGRRGLVLKPSKRKAGCQLLLELLEDRTLLSTVTWMNAGGGDWDTPGNWSPARVPLPTDDAVINLAVTVTHATATADAANSLTLGSTSTLTFSSGSLSVASASPISGTFNLSGGTLSGAGTLTLSGQTTWTGSTLAGPGSVVVANTGTLNIPSGTVTLAGPLVNNGSVDWTGGVVYMTGATLTNNANFTALGDQPDPLRLRYRQ